MGKITEEYSANTTKDRSVTVLCIKCNTATTHKVALSYDYSASEKIQDGQFSIDWSVHYQIIQCQGCKTVSFRQVDWFSEDAVQIGPDEWDDGSVEMLFPKRTQHTRASREFLNVPPNLRRIYRETLECFNNDAFTLGAAGLRALVEGMCSELKVSDGPIEVKKDDGVPIIKRQKSLEGKISGLHEKGVLNKAHSDVLHELRFLGNEAVHELAQPSLDELVLAIDIIEHTLESVFEIPRKAQDLQSRRIKRNDTT